MPEKNDTNVKGIKMTKQRAALLEILKNAEAPLTASQVHALYQQKDPAAWLSTTYRALETFTEKGLVNKTISMDDATATYEFNRHTHKHYAVCRRCKKMIDLECCPIKDLQVKTKDGSFHVTGHRLEVYGYCDDCYLGDPDSK